ncbi:hypothetical protein L596_013664 [Steinernema carpocapsae]|uniref:Uncharacterized protein n=1 Tax=Steinernema carpocapsae TaxID=34508 RepID=A0A4V6A570_STECR|nr:hypothetical protein L596_013664 [Steinernema carpocapsae]
MRHRHSSPTISVSLEGPITERRQLRIPFPIKTFFARRGACHYGRARERSVVGYFKKISHVQIPVWTEEGLGNKSF